MPGKMISSRNLAELINAPEYSSLRSLFHEKRFKKNEIVSYPNHSENSVLLVKKGRVRVYLSSDDKEFTLSILEEGDVYSTHTRAIAQAMEESALLICSTENMGRIMKSYPDIMMNTINVLGGLLKNSITIITNLAFKETDHRLKEYLLSEAEEKGTKCDGGIKVEIGQNTREIAMIIGASRQTVSTHMNELCRSGVLERIGRKTIIIRDMDKLKN